MVFPRCSVTVSEQCGCEHEVRISYVNHTEYRVYLKGGQILALLNVLPSHQIETQSAKMGHFVGIRPIDLEKVLWKISLRKPIRI